MNIEYPKRIPIANLPTKIERLNTLSKILDGPDIYIKRDDLTGCVTSGNKIRKLEFVLADALDHNADTLITCGWINSNHVRATAVVAAKFGLQSILVLRGKEPPILQGNLFLDKLVGAEIRYLSPMEYEKRKEIMEDIVDSLRKKNRVGYSIPTGATYPTGVWGYIMAAEEIKDQMPDLDAIITPVGSGGTYAGLFIGKKLFNLKPTIYGINVERDKEYYKRRIASVIEEWNKSFNQSISFSPEEIEIIDGYQGKGYSEFGEEEIDVIKRLARLEGIILDPVYTGKAMRGLIQEIRNNRFNRKEKILFIHTGGIFGLLSRIQEIRNL
ncbi:D-cysteine desulfhydrase family protein [candidate division WOR-3 bacterium]|nr:D-cysteine desulfhydrase family protein [candidate division WOR-3 bacterium]